jgi:hypothetical protein
MANGSNKPRGPVKMTCSHRQFINLLIELLSFHAWYKYGNAPFGPEYQDGDADSLLTSICQMIIGSFRSALGMKETVGNSRSYTTSFISQSH